MLYFDIYATWKLLVAKLNARSAFSSLDYKS